MVCNKRKERKKKIFRKGVTFAARLIYFQAPRSNVYKLLAFLPSVIFSTSDYTYKVVKVLVGQGSFKHSKASLFLHP